MCTCARREGSQKSIPTQYTTMLRLGNVRPKRTVNVSGLTNLGPLKSDNKREMSEKAYKRQECLKKSNTEASKQTELSECQPWHLLKPQIFRRVTVINVRALNINDINLSINVIKCVSAHIARIFCVHKSCTCAGEVASPSRHFQKTTLSLQRSVSFAQFELFVYLRRIALVEAHQTSEWLWAGIEESTPCAILGQTRGADRKDVFQRASVIV